MGRTKKKEVCQELVGLSGPFTKIARAMSAQWNVRIVPSGTDCKTDGESIYIPFTSDLLPHEKRVLLHGMLDHEVCHVAEEVRHRDAGRPTPMRYFRSEKNGALKMLLNVFEDIRIEQRYEAIYPGMAENIRAVNVDSAKEWHQKNEERQAQNFWSAFGSAIILRARHVEDGWTYEGEMAEWMSLIEEEIAESQQGGEWVDTARDLAQRVYDKVKDRQEQKEKEQQQGGKKGKGRGSADGDSQKSDGKSDGQQAGHGEGQLGSPSEDPDVEDFADAGRSKMSDYVIEDAKAHRRYIPHPKSTESASVDLGCGM